MKNVVFLGLLWLAPFAVHVAHAADTLDPVVQEAEAAVIAELRDPDSVQFRNVAVRQRPCVNDCNGAASVVFVCGEVNAKNGFGGYVGFEPFIYWPAKGMLLDWEFLKLAPALIDHCK